MSRSFWNYAAAVVAAYFQQWQLAAAFLASGVQSEQQRRARNQARDAYNASLQDRMVMTDLQPGAARTLALGRVRTVEGVRRRWSSGTNDTTLTLVVSFAGHEIDAFEQFWFNDTPLTLDAQGWVQTAPFLKEGVQTVGQTVTLDASGNGAVTLSSTPIAGTVTAVSTNGLTGDSYDAVQCVLSGSGVSYTISGGFADSSCQVSWQIATGTPMARIRPYLGASGQNIGADLAAEYPDKITATDRFEGMAAAVVDLLYDPDVFPSGIPNITATLRGAKCLDPRTGLTVWSQNPSIHAYHYARHPNGWAVPVDEIRTQDVEDEADFCDASTTFLLGVDDVVLPRYRSDVVLSLDADPRDNMQAIMDAMAGRWGWAGGQLRWRCGRMAAPTFALDQSWLAQRIGSDGLPEQAPVVRLVNGLTRDARVNRVSGSCVDPEQRYQALPYPTVTDPVLLAADGIEYATTLDLPAVAHIAHAQHLASIVIRQGQAALRMEAQCNLNAFLVELFEVGEVTLPRYGMTAKPFEVQGWRWSPSEGVRLKTAEITAAIFDPVEELTGRDPAPNGDLPSPWLVAQVTGVVVTSGTAELTDTSVITRTRVAWNAVANAAVLVGGHIEVQYTRADLPLPTGDWQSVEEQGGATETVIPGLMTGKYWLFRVRARNAMDVRGKWSAQVLHRVAMPPSGGGGFLVLEASGALFQFADGTTHTSTSLPITFTARLVGLAGTVTWTATAYDAMTGGAAIGAVTMTTNGNAATMTAAQFTAPGTLGSVRRVDVTATLGGTPPESVSVYRYDPTVSSALLWLSNAQSVVPTDEAGEFGDYSGASTYAAVYKGNGSVIQDLTSAHTWTIAPDSGVTATINGGAGPVSGASSILIAVSDMTIDDGAVLVTATPGSGPALTATFRVVKAKASGTGWTAYWEPGSLTLPVGDDGNVSGSGSSDFVIVNAQNQLSDTDNWAKSITTRNVVATLTGARATVTDWLPLGQVTSGAAIPATPAADWTRAGWLIYTPQGNWLQLGFNNAGNWATFRRTTDYTAAPWADVTVSSGAWYVGDASGDSILVIEVTGSSNRYLRSTDDGLTWNVETLPSGAQRTDCIHTGAEWLISSHGSTTGYRSVTGAPGTWSAVTLPGAGCQMFGGAGVVVATTSSGTQWYSTDGGVTWTAMTDGYTGAATFRGRLYTVLSSDPTKMLVWDGSRWIKQALPGTAAGLSALLVVSDVLYVVAGGTVQYTTDGLTWRAGSSGASTLGAWTRSGGRSLQVDFLPSTDTTPAVSNYAKRTLLSATSDTVGSVTMLATKPDEADIQRVLPVYKGQAARVLYVASADPAILMLPATSDGVVTSYAGATVTGKITADGVDVTSLYSITWGATNLTPASGSGAVVNITAMPQAATEGTIVWQAVRAGYPVVNGTTFVRKSLSTDPSGPKLGRAFTVTAVSATYVALKFGADGYWYTKVGSGGAWVVQDRWVVGASPSAFWLYIPTPPEGPFSSGTTDTWLSLASDRIYVLDDATPGTHTRTVVVGMNSSASDVGAGWGNGALRLIV